MRAAVGFSEFRIQGLLGPKSRYSFADPYFRVSSLITLSGRTRPSIVGCTPEKDSLWS